MQPAMNSALSEGTLINLLTVVKLQVNNIPGIEEVNMIKDDGTVIHFNNPKVQASLAANTFAVTGHGENKQITDLLPGILNQLGAESLTHLKKLASNVPTGESLLKALVLSSIHPKYEKGFFYHLCPRQRIGRVEI